MQFNVLLIAQVVHKVHGKYSNIYEYAEISININVSFFFSFFFDMDHF